MGSFAHDTGEGGISRHHRAGGGDLIWEIGSGYFGCRRDDGTFDADMFAEQATTDQVKMIEIKLSQGAKPGHGGILPGAKVTPEIAETRRVPVGKDCISPSHHTAFGTPRELCAFIAQLRELSGGKPVGFKLCVGRPDELFGVCKAMMETGLLPDFNNFGKYDRYDAVQRTLPYAPAVCAKVMALDEEGNAKKTDYYRMLKLIYESDYSGVISIEYEERGKDPLVGSRKTKALIERALAKARA